MQMFKRLVTDKGIVFAFLSNNSIHKQAPPPSVAQGSFQLLISQHRMKYCYAQMIVVGSSSSNRQILLNRLQIRFRLHISTPQIKFFLLAVLDQFLFQQRHYMVSRACGAADQQEHACDPLPPGKQAKSAKWMSVDDQSNAHILSISCCCLYHCCARYLAFGT
jgi:hypothetical protein